MANFEREADFATGKVKGASYTLRPDAIAPLVSPAPGPSSLGNSTHGILYKGWYVRPDPTSGDVWLGESDGTNGWKDEEILFSLSASNAASMAALAFDRDGYPVVAMERADGDVWVRYWDGDAYQLTALAVGEAPCIVHRAPDSSAWAEVWLFYQRGTSVYYRLGSEDYATEHDALLTLTADQKLWRAIHGQNGRIHLITSTRDSADGTYTLQRISSGTFPASCVEAVGYESRIDDGVDTMFVFRGDGYLETSCLVELDVLLVGAGGNSGGMAQADPTILWADGDGYPLDPDVDAPLSDYKADGGGYGGNSDTSGGSGGSGGGGGGHSPSGNSMWTSGGQGTDDQGHAGGGGQSTWGLLIKHAASGGGGGYGEPGTGGQVLQGLPNRPGEAGRGKVVDGWNAIGPRGGKGALVGLHPAVSNTGDVNGGGGAGGVKIATGIQIPPNQRIPITVGQGFYNAAAGQGGDSVSGLGITGMAVIRMRRLDLTDADPADLSGGAESLVSGYDYYEFTGDGTIVVNAPGQAEVLVIGGGGGGGSGAGGGGGGGDVRRATVYLWEDEDVVVGDGGGGGIAGSNGEDGGDSSVGSHASALGGGGGAGDGLEAGSRASGGGGAGSDGDGGVGTALRGYPGGDGNVFDLSAGGFSKSAGGGGGAGGDGDGGATVETQGNELADDWELPGDFALNISLQSVLATVNADHAMISKEVAVEEMFAQGQVNLNTTQTTASVMVRAEHPTSDPDEAPVGYAASINASSFMGTAYPIFLSNDYILQAYAEDDLQEYGFHDPSDGSQLTADGADAGRNGVTASFGFRVAHNAIPNFAQAVIDNLLCCLTKYLEVGSVPIGGKVQVLDTDGAVVAEANESGGGTALVDLSIYGGCISPVPMIGFAEIVVLDSGDIEVARRSSAGIYPGGQYDVDGTDLEIRLDMSGAEPVPIIGPLKMTIFNELTPGPENGDGGEGVDLADWNTDGYAGGGGGGGADDWVAGEGGKGGGGAGAYGAGLNPDNGESGTGGGGGGSGDASVNGGNGGSGIVIIRVQHPYTLSLVTDGLVLKDGFDRADGTVIGNGWQEGRGDWAISGGKVQVAGTATQILYNEAAASTEQFLQALLTPYAGGAMGIAFTFLWNAGNERGWIWQANADTGNWRLLLKGPSYSESVFVADPEIASGIELPAQVFCEDTGGDDLVDHIELWGNGHTQVQNYNAFGPWNAGLAERRASGTPTGKGDDFIWCGTKYIRASSIPTGFKLRIVNASDATVNEAVEDGAGNVELDMSMYTGDATELVPLNGWVKAQLLDGSDNVVAEYTGPVYPGHVFVVS